MNPNAFIFPSASQSSSSAELLDDQLAPTTNELCTDVLNSQSRDDQYDILRLINLLGPYDPTSDQVFGICDTYNGFPVESLSEDPMLTTIFSENQDQELTTQGQSLSEEYQIPELTSYTNSSLQGYQYQELSGLQVEPSNVSVASCCADTVELPFTSLGLLQTSYSDDLQCVAFSDLAPEKFQIPRFPASDHQNASCIDIGSSHLSSCKKIKHSYKPTRKHPRTKREPLDPQKYYRPLPITPTSWGSLNDYKEPTFVYNEYGELSPGVRYSADQIREYLYNHRLNTRNGIHDPLNSGLILWIQTVPAFSSRRYPCQLSDKCRFAACPAPKDSIMKGFYRVAFDEQTATGHPVDPFHCTGFVHLWCLERFCSFPQMCKDLNIQPDIRHLPEGKNKMAITRDHEEMYNVVKRFMAKSQPLGEYEYMRTLNYQLITTHLDLEADVRQALREERGGNHIGLHKGDLQKYVEGEETKKCRGKSAVLGNEKKSAKRKLDSFTDEVTTEVAAPSHGGKVKKSKGNENASHEDPNYREGEEVGLDQLSGATRQPRGNEDAFSLGFWLEGS